MAAASAPGIRVEEVAQRYGICTSLIYRWRRATSGPALNAPAVRLVPRKSEPSAVVARSKPETKRVGQIEIELENGIRVRVDPDVSVAALRRVVTALRG